MSFKKSKYSEVSGLTWTEATKRLRNSIEEELQKYKIKRSDVIRYAFGHNISATSLCWAFVGYLFIGVLIYFLSSAFQLTLSNDENVVAYGFVLTFLLVLAVTLSIYTNYLKETEMYRKTRSLLKEMDNLVEENNFFLASSSLYGAPSDNIALQWTFRNGKLVNLPWILLVEGDLILLRAGRESPARGKRVKSASRNADCEFDMGQIYIPDDVYRARSLAVEPFEPLLCVVTETAVLRYLRTCLNANQRPPSLLENEYRRIVHFYVERFVVPACLALSVFVSAVCYVFTDNPNGSWYETLIFRPFLVVLPILSPIVPMFTFIFYLYDTSVLLTQFDISKDISTTNVYQQTTKINNSSNVGGGNNNLQHLFAEQMTGGEKIEHWSKRLKNLTRTLSKMFDILLGDPTNLPFSANPVFTLGNLTSLSVVDKKGILSWTNPSPEKVFFFSPSRDNRLRRHLFREQSVSTCSLYSTPNNYSDNTTTNVNNTTTNTPSVIIVHSTEVDYDKENNVVSKENKENNVSKENKENNLVTKENNLVTKENNVVSKENNNVITSSSTKENNNVVISSSSPHNTPTRPRKALKSSTVQSPKVNTEVLDLTHDPNHEFLVHFDDSNWSNFSNNLKPLGLNILLNGCTLQSDYIRFMDHVLTVSHAVPRTISVVSRRCLCYFARAIGFRREASSQFEHTAVIAAYKRTPGEVPLPGLTKHKTPLPNMFCTVVKDKLSDHKQIMCQGTTDLILDSCDFYWDGRSVKKLQRAHRKKINDFAHRYGMTSYCVAFSYRPLSNEISDLYSDFYVDWPLDSCKSASSSDDTLFQSECRPPLAVSFDSLLTDDYFSLPPVKTADDCLKYVLKNQVFLGIISLQYQAKLDVVRLVDNLDKACIRFVHYSKENELRSRVFAEKCGLEAGWNCHISLARDERREVAARSSNVKSAASISNVSSRASLPLKGRLPPSLVHRELSISSTPTCPTTKQSRINSFAKFFSWLSLPKDLKIDLPIVHFKSVTETPMDELPPQVIFSEEEDEQKKSQSPDSVFGYDDNTRPSTPRMTERTPMLSETTTSHTSLITNQSSTTGLSASAAFFMTNRAQLPKGIESVRPHLRDIDNVPLLVPLFTDCYPEAIREMIEIMQENGEIVCVLGSTLNYRNAEIFCQANASIGVEPVQPPVCVHDDHSTSDDNCEGDEDSSYAVWLAHLISSLPCSLSIGVGERISLLNLIAVSRHLLMVTRTSLVFYLNSSLFLTCLQFCTQLVLAPPLLTTGSVLYLIVVVIPLVSGSLAASSRDDDASLKFATPKNVASSSLMVVKMFLLGFLVKFLPTVFVCTVLYKVALIFMCWPDEFFQRRFCPPKIINTAANNVINIGGNTTKSAVAAVVQQFQLDSKFLSDVDKSALKIIQIVFGMFLLIYICLTSVGYVHYKQTIRRQYPFTNKLWTFVIALVIFVQIVYTLVAGYGSNSDNNLNFATIPWYIYVSLVVWIPLVIVLNEIWKMYEIRIWLREQRRRRLLYQTKLGMNSPF